MVGVVVGAALLTSLASAYAATSGDLDPSFGVGGIVNLENGSGGGAESANDVVQMADGTVFIVGATVSESSGPRSKWWMLDDGGNPLAAESRFATNAATGFDTSGENSIYRAVRGPSGRILLGGFVTRYNDLGDSRVFFQVERLTSSGSFDPTFSGDGRAITSVGTEGAWVQDLAEQGNGRIVAVGPAVGAAGHEVIAAVRYTAAGAIDPSFGKNGRVLIDPFGFGGEALGVAIQPDGKVLIAGSTYEPLLPDDTRSYVTVVRLTSNGTRDSTFSGDGIATVQFGANNAEGADVAVQSDGRIVVAGTVISSTGNKFALARLRANGSLDLTFDVDGRVITSFAGGGTMVEMELGSGGAIYAGGRGAGAVLAKYLISGKLDTTFSGDGRVVVGDLPKPDGMTLDAEGRVLLVGDGSQGGVSAGRILG